MVRLLFQLILGIYILAALCGFKKKGWLKVLLGIGLIIQTIGLILISFAAGHPPFTNLYESLLFLSWLVLLVWILGLRRYQWEDLGSWAAILSSAGIIYSLTFSWKAQPLMPALQSPWLHIHVSSCFLAYALFGLAAVSGLIYLVRPGEKLARMNLTLIRLGFPLLSFGIINGAIWAYSAWGRYWGWDPKEVWALISWLFYLGILHSRFLGVGKKGTDILSIIGFLLILFTFLGVNLLLSGLHSYA